MQSIQLIGYLGKDPETKYITNGTAVTKFSVAVTERWKSRDGEKQERVEWFNVETWGKLAEICGEYLHKGAQIYLKGKNQTSTWDKDGETRYSTVVRADEVEFLKTDRDRNSAPKQPANGKLDEPAQEEFDEDIPF